MTEPVSEMSNASIDINTQKTVYLKCGDKDCEKNYKFKRVLGQGAFACVKLADHKVEKTQWAVKILKKDALVASDLESLENEITIVQQVRHPNIVYTKEVYDTPHFCFVIMECMKGGELFDRIVRQEHYSEVQAKEAFWQMVDAISYCHKHNIVHRDLKPENLLYADTTDNAALKLADFGLAQIVRPDEMMHHACGTPGYIAPEILNGQDYGSAVDMWSLGVILYILICGFPPFYDEDETQLFRSIKSASYEFVSPYWDDTSEEVRDLITKLLELDPAKRFTAEQTLGHIWLSGDFPHKTIHKCGTIAQMKKFNARRRLRGAVRAIIGIHAMNVLGNSKEENTEDHQEPVANQTPILPVASVVSAH